MERGRHATSPSGPLGLIAEGDTSASLAVPTVGDQVVEGESRLKPAVLKPVAGASSVTAELEASADQDGEQAETVTLTASHGKAVISSVTEAIRSVADDAELRKVGASHVGFGTYSHGTRDCTATVSHEAWRTSVAATASHVGTRVVIEQRPDTLLPVGPNAIAISVKAEDGTSTNTDPATVEKSGVPLTASYISQPEAHSRSAGQRPG